jgi:hypothetical protein
MDQNFQSSFIPKEPMTEEKVFKKKKAGVSGVLSLSLFIVSIIASVGMYAYKSILNSDIQSLESQMASAEKSIDTKSIDEMVQFSNKLQAAKDIVSKHEVISGFMNSLASSTVSTVQFIDFKYSEVKGGLVVSMKGKTNSYASVALQENIFSQNKSFRLATFSNLTLGEGGLVLFDVSINVDPQIAVYAPQSNTNI